MKEIDYKVNSNLEMLKIKERGRYNSYPTVIQSIEKLSNFGVYEDDILEIDKILSMTGISHLYKDKHRSKQNLINDLQKYGNLKLAIKNLDKKININSKKTSQRQKQRRDK